ncbi:hypothetical protein TNCV_2959091 [Trichonephila clavipes]|nr:hypothetical protein TNCV_2959091 [Trichonephila clavipes]
MGSYRSPLTVTLWPSSFLKKYGPMIPPAHEAHQTAVNPFEFWSSSFSDAKRFSQEDLLSGSIIVRSYPFNPL